MVVCMCPKDYISMETHIHVILMSRPSACGAFCTHRLCTKRIMSAQGLHSYTQLFHTNIRMSLWGVCVCGCVGGVVNVGSVCV